MNSNSLLNAIEKFTDSRTIWTLFFFTSAIIFAPIFLHLDYIMSNTDNVFNHYPNLIYGYRALRSGHLGLWNPYIFLGEDFTGSMHNHMLNPFNWILLLFPEKSLLHVISLIEFIEITLVGIFSYKIFSQFIPSRSAAILPALVTQLSGFTWFVTTTYIGVELFLLATLFIYLILTGPQRSTLFNFIFMSLCSFGIFAVGHIGYIIAFFIPIIFMLGAFNRANLLTPWKGIIGICILAMGCGLALAAYRMVPILLSLHNYDTAAWLDTPSGNHAYFLLTGIMPGILGFNINESVRISTLIGTDGHIQIHNFLYYGLPIFYLAIMALFSVFGKKGLLISLLSFFLVSSQIFLIQPLADIANIILYPCIHTIVARVAVTFSFFTLTAIIANSLARNEYQITAGSLRALIATTGVLVCAAIALLLKELYSESSFIANWSQWFWPLFWSGKLLLTAILLGFSVLALRHPLNAKTSRVLTNISFTLFALIAFTWSTLTIRNHLFHDFNVTILELICGNFIWSLLVAYILRSPHATNKKTRLVSIGLFIIGLALLLINLQHINEEWASSLFMLSFYSLDLLIIASFLVIAFLTLELFVSLFENYISHKEFLLILCLLLFGHLLFAIKIYSYSGGHPFMHKFLYRPIIYPNYKMKFDFSQFRVTHPKYLLINTPWAGFDPYSNIPMVYNLRSYAGVDSYFSNDLKKYIANFSTNDALIIGRSGISPTLSNNRALDLMGVKYDFSSYVPTIRPKALARFAFFTSFEVVPTTGEQYKILKDPLFDIDTTILLSSKPQAVSKQHKTNFMPVSYVTKSSDHISMAINIQKPGIVQFGDSYSPDWKAYWNGNEIPIMLSNGLFMAVEKPAGSGILTFIFKPEVFYKSLRVSMATLILLSLLSLYGMLRGIRRKI